MIYFMNMCLCLCLCLCVCELKLDEYPTFAYCKKILIRFVSALLVWDLKLIEFQTWTKKLLSLSIERPFRYPKPHLFLHQMFLFNRQNIIQIFLVCIVMTENVNIRFEVVLKQKAYRDVQCLYQARSIWGYRKL